MKPEPSKPFPRGGFSGYELLVIVTLYVAVFIIAMFLFTYGGP